MPRQKRKTAGEPEMVREEEMETGEVSAKAQEEMPAIPGEQDKEACVERLKACIEAEGSPEEMEELLWETLRQFQGCDFTTAKGLTFRYVIRGNEMFVDRKEKSITRASVSLSFQKALEVQSVWNCVSGPKKLGTFGASYLYPIFLRLGVIKRTPLV